MPLADPGDETFGGYAVDDRYRLQKQSRVYWSRSCWVELHELCSRLNAKLEYDEGRNLYGVVLLADDDDVIRFRYVDHQQLYSAIKRLEVSGDLQHFQSLQRQDRLQRETLPHTDMSCTVGHLTNSGINDRLTSVVTKGRLQLLETYAVNSTYFPAEYMTACPLCSFQLDTNSHAMNCCRQLKGLYIERHDRCVEMVRREVERAVVTDHVAVFENQSVSLDGETFIDNSSVGLTSVSLTIIMNSVAFIVELANPFDCFIDQCYSTCHCVCC